MPLLVLLFFCLASVPGFSQDPPAADSASAAPLAPDSARKQIDTSLARTADTSGAEDEEDEEDSVEINADSLSALRTAYDLTGLSQHIGSNGLTLFFSFVKQFDGRNTTLPTVHSFGAGFSGDVLTGLSFVHLIPTFHYWSYSENVQTVFVEGQTYRDVAVAFHSVLVTPRLSARKARAFLGAGPSLHLMLITQDLGAGLTNTASNFNNGFSILAGAELPLTGAFSFVSTAVYKQTYDWSKLDRRYLMVSIGLAM